MHISTVLLASLGVANAVPFFFPQENHHLARSEVAYSVVNVDGDDSAAPTSSIVPRPEAPVTVTVTKTPTSTPVVTPSPSSTPVPSSSQILLRGRADTFSTSSIPLPSSSATPSPSGGASTAHQFMPESHFLGSRSSNSTASTAAVARGLFNTARLLRKSPIQTRNQTGGAY